MERIGNLWLYPRKIHSHLTWETRNASAHPELETLNFPFGTFPVECDKVAPHTDKIVGVLFFLCVSLLETWLVSA